MADSSIEWTDKVWNPTSGCDRVSDGCTNCYALTMARRLKAMGARGYDRDGDPRTSGPGFALTLHPWMLERPIRWRTPSRIFVNSMSDLFHDDVPLDYLARVFAVMALTPRHTYQVLTKRHARMRSVMHRSDFRTAVDLVLAGWAVGPESPFKRAAAAATEKEGMGWVKWPLPNVWLGVSVEDQRWADIRIPALLDTPAAVRFLSCEPLLGPVNLRRVFACSKHREVYADESGPCPDCYPLRPPIDWVITGGESGVGHRPLDPDWVRRIRDDCYAAGVAFLHKQNGGRTSKAGGRELDGQTWDEYPQIPSTAGTLL